MKKRHLLGFASNTLALLASAASVSHAYGQNSVLGQPPKQSASTTGGGSPASDARLQVYDIPIETVGTVAAQLQLQYGSDRRVRVTNEPGTGRLMVLAPETQQQLIAQYVNAVKAKVGTTTTDAKGNPLPPTIQQTNYKLQVVNAKQFEDAIGRLAGNRMSVVELGNGKVSLRLSSPSGPHELMQVDRSSNFVHVSGTPANVVAWNQVIAAIDLGQSDPNRPTQIVPINPASPESIERAVHLVRFASFQQGTQTQEDQETGVAQLPRTNAQRQNDPATVIASPENLSSGTGLIGDVDISFVNEMGLVIIKGSKKDVERVLEVIDKIKKQSEQTKPDIELKMLKHVNSQALSVIINEINTAVFQPRQGQVNITALGQPNALLLIGRKEAMVGLLELIDKLDAPLDPDSSLKVFPLIHTSSVDAETLIRNFFGQPTGATGGGATATTPTGLSPQVKVVSDFRTNSLIVQASQRDLAEVARLIQQIDVESTPAESQIRVFPIKNAVASELQTIIAAAIGGQSVGGTGAQGGGGGGGGNQGAATTTSQARTPSSKLTIVPRDANGVPVDSGILSGVVVTTSPAINALVVRAPSKSMPLVAALIDQLDRLPSAEARVKVFPVINSDATSLTTVLSQVFGLATPTTNTNANGAAALFGFQNLAALTTGSENSLVPLRLSTDARTNSIIASGSATDLEVIEALLYRLDDTNGQQRVNEVVWLRNSDASSVFTALNTLFTNQRQFITQRLQTGQQISVFEQIDREVFVIAEPQTNCLVISATPRYMSQILDVVNRIDRQLPMIAVEILVAEVTLDDTFELGNEFGLQDALLFDRGSASRGTLSSPGFNVPTPPGNGVTAGRPAQVAGQGLTGFGLGRANTTLGYGGLVLAAGSESVNMLFRALQDANRVQILSRPNLLTLDNNISVITVGAQVPRITGTSVNQFGQQQNQIENADVGLTMQIQPRTNQDGLVNMIVSVQRSALGNIADGIPIGFGPNGEPVLSPIINRTLAQTRVTAYDGQTVVLGGLITKSRTSRSRRVPWLGSIPIAGLLFRYESEDESRTELLVVMTPRVINGNDSAKLDMIKQVESSRMSWCMADILNIHGDVGLSPGNGLWGPAASPVIYPDLQPTAEYDSSVNPNLMIGEPEGVILQDQPVIMDPNAKSLLKNTPSQGNPPSVNQATPFQNSSYQMAPTGQADGSVSQASYQPVGPTARLANPTQNVKR